MNGPSVCVRARSRRSRGFTLIEVLIASFIIAIGLIGLTALFAGVAGQQQLASLVSLGDSHARNAEAVLGPLFGRLVESDQANSQQMLNVWRPVTANEDDYSLIVDDSGSPIPRRWFLADAARPLPITVFSQGPSDPDWGGGDPTSELSFALFNFDFGERGIDPESLRIRVTVIDGFGTVWSEREYFRTPGLSYFDNPEAFGPVVFPADGDPEATGFNDSSLRDTVRVDLQLARDGVVNAKITSVWIRDVFRNQGTFFIGKIEVVAYKTRQYELVSLGDRVLYRDDASAPGGRRPFMSYSLLFRQADSSTDLALFVYQLTPGSASAEWGPPETLNDFNASPARSPLRQTDLLLGFDEEREQYFFIPEVGREDDSEWALVVGQQLLVAGYPGAGANVAAQGASEPVRVVSTDRVNNKLRGYLERGPRAGRQGILPVDERRSGQFQRVRIIGVNDTVTSEEDDSVWRLRPLGSYVIRVSLGGA